jgi:hypothetical protein
MNRDLSVCTVKSRGAALKATEQPIDTSTAAGKCFLDMLGVADAHFGERDLLRGATMLMLIALC